MIDKHPSLPGKEWVEASHGLIFTSGLTGLCPCCIVFDDNETFEPVATEPTDFELACAALLKAQEAWERANGNTPDAA